MKFKIKKLANENHIKINLNIMPQSNFTNALLRVNDKCTLTRNLLLLLVVGILFYPLTTKAQYCIPTSFSPYGECAGGSLLNVSFNTIQKPLTCVFGGVPADYYKDLTTTVAPTSIAPGGTYPLSVTHSVTWAGGASVWIDYNCNQVFETNERVLFSSTTSIGGILSANITVPITAKAGFSRMRVMATEGGVPTVPCDPGTYAEAADFAITILPKPLNNAAVIGKQEIGNFCSGPSANQNIQVRVANYGLNRITSLQINWQVDGMTQSPIGFNNLIDTIDGLSAKDTLLLLGSVLFNTPTAKNIKAWTSIPNGVADITNGDDTLAFTLRPLMDGPYTIGYGGDFNSLTEAITQLQKGICGPVTLDFLGTNNAFEEQVTFSAIPGASSINTVTINGNNNILTFNTSVSGSRHVVKFQGAKHITLNSLVIKPTNTTYGWGIHLTGNADSNTINGCRILLESVTSTTPANSAGIVINNSTTTAITAGGPNIGNTLSNNYIKGSATGIMYYGIVIAPSTASTTASYTKVINNTIEDYYAYGIYATQINNATIKGNIIRNVTKTTNNTTVWGIALITSARLSTISDNQISNPFGTITNSTSTFYGIQSTSTVANTPSGNENLFINNTIFRAAGNGPFYGISLEPAPYSLIYHNSINFDNTSSATTTETRGIYQTGAAAGIQLRNNIVSITRGGTGLKHLLYFNTSTNIILSNNNGLFITTSANNHVGYSSTTNRTLLTDWTTATTQDAASVLDNPVFAYAATGNLEPQSSILNDIGFNLNSIVPNDIRQNVRSSTPDPGAFEYAPSGCFTPLNIIASNATNAGAQISWTAPSATPSGYEYYIDTVSTIPTGSGISQSTAGVIISNLLPTTKYYFYVRSTCPASSAWAGPITFTTLCAPLPGGTYTLGGPGADFSSFTQLANKLNCGSGISGPVIINVTPGSPAFNEQFVLGNILNASPINSITINGNGNTIQSNASSAQRSVIRLEGASFVTIDSLIIKTTNATYGWGVHFYLNAINNIVKNCTIDMSAVTSTDASSSAGIVFSNSLTAATTTGNNGRLNTIEHNLITGNPTGAGMYYGIVLAPTTNANTFSGNQILRNTIRNFYSTGIHCISTYGSTIKNNIIENTTKTSLASSVFGISMNTGYRGDIIADNEIKNLTGGTANSSATLYGISLSNTATTPVGFEMNVFNNTIFNLKGTGNIYGIYASNATNIRYYHNTIILNDSNAGSGFTRGFYHTGALSGGGLLFKNNIVCVNRNTSGTNHGIYLSNSDPLYFINNNAYWTGGSNAFIGYASINISTLDSWKSNTGLDANSRFSYADFVDLNNNNLIPDAGLINNIGANLQSIVSADKNSNARPTNPDPGAFEFTPTKAADAGIFSIILPEAMPIGAIAPQVTIFNAGAADLTSAFIDWTVNGVSQPTQIFSGTIPSGGISDPVTLSGFSFAQGITYNIKFWTSNPNNITDEKMSNDTASVGNITTAIPGGNYTINSHAPNSATNFNTFADFTQKAEAIGISGQIILNVLDTFIQGPIVFGNKIRGTTAAHNIIIKSTDTTTTISSSTNNTITLNNVDHVVFRDMTIKNTNASSSSVIWLTNSADSNSIVNCTISSPIVSSAASTFGVLASASNTSKSAGNNAKGTLIDSCIVTGANEAIAFIGISLPALPEGAVDPRTNSYNHVSHSVINNAYSTAIHAELQSSFIADYNQILTLGNKINTFPAGINLRDNLFFGSLINGNTITGALGGQGIASIFDVSVNSVVSNNMIQMGTASNDVLAIRWIGTSASFLHNSVNVTTLNTNGTALYIAPNAGNSYRVYNNILKNTRPGQLVNYNWSAGITLSIDNNVYYGTGTFPYRYNNANYATLADLQTAMPAGTDVHSLTIDPVFVSDSNLRTFNPVLNDKGTPSALVFSDIDGNLRSTTTPDLGVNEYNLPPVEDAGVIAITSPSLPVVAGASTNVNIIIKNLGVGPLNNVDVNYSVNSVTRTIPYVGNLAEGQTDTVRFNISNALGMTIPTTGFIISAWTNNPNFLLDKNTSNDSLTLTFCQPMSGVYTIDPLGTATNNFLSFNEAINTLKCGGVNDAVVINVASGTYNEQFEIPGIPGASDHNTITFKSATGNKSDVQVGYASTNDSNNFVAKLAGAKYVVFSDMSFSNTGSVYSRIFSFIVAGGKTNEFITIKNCAITGTVPTVNSNNSALIFAPENNLQLRISNNVFNNGGTSILISGNPVVGQYSDGLIIDSNQLNNFVYSGIGVSIRKNVIIKNNVLTSSSTTIVNSLSTYNTSGNIEVVGNKVNILQGSGITLYNNAYYNEAGRALVASNAVLLQSTTNVSQTGIKIQGGSKVDVYNNTIRTRSSSTASEGLHIEGDITYANLLNTASYDFNILNNIIQTQNGYPVNVAPLIFDPNNAISRNAIALINNNIYYNVAGTNVAKVLATEYLSNNFNSFKNAIKVGSDNASKYLPIVFENSNSVKPLETDTTVWYVNGRAVHLALVNLDASGKLRSTIPFTGVPDMGAFEITPSVLPPLAKASPALPAPGTSQLFTFNGDTVAKIVWDALAPVPDSVEVRQFVGEIPPSLGGINDKHMFSYISLEMPMSGTGNSYNYNVDLNYKSAWLGTVASESILHMAIRDSFQFWSMVPNSTRDIVLKTISGEGLTDHNLIITGGDLNNPLPVTLLSFNAQSKNKGVMVEWKTATEADASHFAVERSTDGVNFSVIRNSKANNKPSSYQYYDDLLNVSKTKIVYYRLKAVDLNGAFEYSRIVPVNLSGSTENVAIIAPNPVDDLVNVQFATNVNAAVQVSLFDMQGQLLSNHNFEIGQKITIPSDQLKQGLYLLKVSYDNKEELIRFLKK
jgi:hypothetical protein